MGEDAEEAGMDGFHGAMVYLGDALGRAEADHIVEQFDIGRRQTVISRSSSADEAPQEPRQTVGVCKFIFFTSAYGGVKR